MSDNKVRPVNQKIRFWSVRLALLACLPLVVLAQPVWGAGLSGLLRVLGTLVVIAAILYRFWAILYIGGRKNRTVVQDGPYSMSRHPLYFGTTLGAAGFGLLLGSVVLAVLLGGLVMAIMAATAAREERFLRAEFGPAYDAFAQRVPNRILPRPAGFTTPDEVAFRPGILRTNLLDALGFLMLIPLAELLRLLRDLGWAGGFPVL